MMKNEKISAEVLLINGLKNSNSDIYDYLFHYYYSSLVVFGERMIHDRDVAEDLVQDFFYRLWMNREQLSIQQSIKSYCFQSIKNRCLDYLKHQKVILKAEKEILFTHSESDGFPDFMAENELNELIQQALDRLPEKCREIFVMNRFDGLKPSEIAEKEQISVRTVEGHIGKALKLLREDLKGYLPAALLVLLLK